MKLFALSLATLALACTTSEPCAPSTPPDAGGCNRTYGVDYDPATQTGCAFVNGAGTPDTCTSLCGAAASCELLTFTTVECTTTCGD